MSELPLHVAVLQRLHQETKAKRDEIKERMAGGMPFDGYTQAVGRTKELKSMLERIEAMLKQLREGDLEEPDDDSDERDPDPTPQRRRSRAR